MSNDEAVRTHRPRTWRRPGGQYVTLLVTLLVLPLVEALVLGNATLEFLYWVALMAVVFAALCAVDRAGRSHWDEVMVLLPGFLAVLSIPIVGLDPREHFTAWILFRHGAGLFAFAVLGVRILRDVSCARVVVFDQVCGGLCVYLMIGFASAIVYTAIERVAPGSFSIDRGKFGLVEDADFSCRLRSLMTYFSFITLTTLGFGDISPLSGVARGVVAIEAMVGQIYLAVFVARLVSLHLAAGTVSVSTNPAETLVPSASIPPPHVKLASDRKPVGP